MSDEAKGSATVRLRNPDRSVSVDAPQEVRRMLAEIGLHPDSVLVIRERDLLTREDVVEPGDTVEVRSVISGGRA